MQQAVSLIAKELGMELTRQGHLATGNLYASLEATVVKTGNDVIGRVSFDEYGIFVDKGRKPGGKRVPLQALIDWIQVMGIATNNKEVVSIAWAMQTKIWQEGIPSNDFGRKRTGWFTDTINDPNLNKQIVALLEKSIAGGYEIQMDDVINKYSRTLK